MKGKSDAKDPPIKGTRWGTNEGIRQLKAVLEGFKASGIEVPAEAGAAATGEEQKDATEENKGAEDGGAEMEGGEEAMNEDAKMGEEAKKDEMGGGMAA